jgi:hypothetical protein
MKKVTSCLCLVLILPSLISSLDLGRGGVYDSPSAQDYWIKRFGFMFGGGRSGMKGIRALQQSVDMKARSHRDNFYKRKLSPVHSSPKEIMLLKERMKDQGSQFSKPKLAPLRSSPKSVYLLKEKKMVEMEPMMIQNSLDRSDRKARYFKRFKAVPL